MFLGPRLGLSRGHGGGYARFHSHRRVRVHGRCRGPYTDRSDARYRGGTLRAFRCRESASPSPRAYPNWTARLFAE